MDMKNLILAGAIALMGATSAQAQTTEPDAMDKAWVALNT